MTPPARGPSRFSHDLAGLYLLLDSQFVRLGALLEILRWAGECGVRIVQYRNKLDSMAEAFAQASRLREMADTMGMIFVVNDRCDLALAVGAHGVHLGQSDLPIASARELMGPEALIGRSTHSPEQVVRATQDGADYLGFGPIGPTGTKPDHDPVVGISGLRLVRALTPLPIFAIGGMTPSLARQARAAGANGVAVASGILADQDPCQALRRFTEACR